MALVSFDEIDEAADASGSRTGLTQAKGDFLRDSRGTPWVTDPSGDKVKSGERKGEPKRVRYGRPSSFGKDIENTYNLQRWNERQVVFGAAIGGQDYDAALAELIDVPFDSDEARRRADGVVVVAKRLAKAGLAAERGTHMHAVTEDDDTEVDWLLRAERGEILDIPIPVQAAMLDAWRRMLDAYGFEVVATEARVVHDRWRLAGTLDRLVRATRDVAFVDGKVVRAGAVVLLDIKGLALDTLLPTPTGWTTMGAIAVGDQVIGSDGRPCNVVHKSELRERPCYRITFADGTSVVADDEHRWAVDTARKGAQVLTTQELARSLFANGQRQHRVNNPEPLQLADADLPLDPYVLGLWLGDGKHTSGEITKPIDNGIWAEVERRGFTLGKPYIDRRTGCATHTVLGLRGVLAKMRVLGDKHVPAQYLRGSRQQRLDLLRGLMDSDGTWNKARRRAAFTSTDKALSLVVYELVVSLGERAHLSSVPTRGFGKDVTAHNVEWAPSVHNPFCEPAKAARAMVRDTGFNTRRVIVSVDEVPMVPTQCIAVDSPDRTYLCTESMVVTHNTGRITYESGGKTVNKLEQGDWHSYAIQCAAYAGSVPYDCDTGKRGLWGDPIDQQHAIIAHLPVAEALAGKAVCRLVLVNLEPARRAVEQVILPMLEWRKRRDLFHLTADSEPTVELEIGQADAPAEDTELVDKLERSIAAVRSVKHDFGKPDTPVAEDPAVLLRRKLTGRIALLKTDHIDAARALVRAWPEGVPPLSKSDSHSLEQLEAIDGAVMRIEAQHGVPF